MISISVAAVAEVRVEEEVDEDISSSDVTDTVVDVIQEDMLLMPDEEPKKSKQIK